LIIFFSELAWKCVDIGTILQYMHSQNFGSSKIGLFQSDITSHLIK